MNKPGKAMDEQKPQFRSDQHEIDYDNDVPLKSWLREDATTKPGYDKLQAYRGGKLRED